MGVEAYAAAAVSEQQFGVMILLLRDVRNRVHKSHGLEKVLEAIGLFYGDIRAVIVELPALGFGQACYDLCSC